METTRNTYNTGKTAYKMKIELSGNPYKGSLAQSWVNGWKSAASSDTSTLQHTVEDRDDDKPRSNAETIARRTSRKR